MKKFFTMMLLAFAAFYFVSCKPEDNVNDGEDSPKITLSIDGRTIEYNYAYNKCLFYDEATKIYAHNLSFTNYDANIGLENAENPAFIVITYATFSKTLSSGEILPVSEENLKNEFRKGVPLYLEIKIKGALGKIKDDSDYDYTYNLLLSVSDLTSDQPAISVAEKDGIYTISFEDIVFTDGEGNGNYKASLEMNGKLEFSEHIKPGTSSGVLDVDAVKSFLK